MVGGQLVNRSPTRVVNSVEVLYGITAATKSTLPATQLIQQIILFWIFLHE